MRKISRVLFSRYSVSAIVILAELLLLAFLTVEAYEYSIFALALIYAVNAAVILTLVNRSANPEYKVSWLLVVMMLPPFGAILYALFYSRRLTRREARMMKEIKENLSRREGEGSALDGIDEAAVGKARAILNDDPIARAFRNTESVYYGSGEEMFRDMLRDIEAAERYVFLEYFIIGEGVMWNEIHTLLRRKASEGVEVRVLYDDIGCMKTLPGRYDRLLMSEGINCRRFEPVTPRVTTSHNNRDHRKITVVDGKVAYTGGINIADEYINEIKRFGHWKDGGVRLYGDAAEGLLREFISVWDLCTRGITNVSDYLSKVGYTSGDGGVYIPFGSGPAPSYSRAVGKCAILNLINQAQRYVYITTPYLILDHEVTESLCNAVGRGVDVRIITPAVADKRLVKIMTKSSYHYLIKAGVRIYEYTPGFIHAKMIISDDLYAMIGTINLDFRSLFHHFEDAVWIYGSDTVISAKGDFLSTLDNSKEQDIKRARLRPVEWIATMITRIIAPLL